MMCACGRNDGFYFVGIKNEKIIIESKCCITTIVATVDHIEFSV